MASSVAAKQLATAQKFVDGYNEWTAQGVVRARSDDCVHAVLPVSLNRPPRTNADYKLFFGNVEPHMSDFHMKVVKIVNDPEQKMAVVHATGNGETPFMPYRNEYAFFLAFSEDREKVERIEEFLDSKFTTEFFQKMQEYLQHAQKA
ncbi:hypothetical protein M409DRAFT_49108 [Zasmidium cellare ATCC 36951]|uniref:Uncharacterized protein n=1 Tax=Zasmidium cellare ATCC 36951 TaxID=1080233 RepID=A0A6A6D727_ZASCE|nr:uncharacterized protein M409DRAFT_49108 [Zasmidium cellare ATCC 36951]KAF2174248.1 hypothetical protein M409DRAFT_49108 [Zasmidium cellare ATCC 36951]